MLDYLMGFSRFMTLQPFPEEGGPVLSPSARSFVSDAEVVIDHFTARSGLCCDRELCHCDESHFNRLRCRVNAR